MPCHPRTGVYDVRGLSHITTLVLPICGPSPWLLTTVRLPAVTDCHGTVVTAIVRTGPVRGIWVAGYKKSMWNHCAFLFAKVYIQYWQWTVWNSIDIWNSFPKQNHLKWGRDRATTAALPTVLSVLWCVRDSHFSDREDPERDCTASGMELVTESSS